MFPQQGAITDVHSASVTVTTSKLPMPTIVKGEQDGARRNRGQEEKKKREKNPATSVVTTQRRWKSSASAYYVHVSVLWEKQSTRWTSQ